MSTMKRKEQLHHWINVVVVKVASGVLAAYFGTIYMNPKKYKKTFCKYAITDDLIIFLVYNQHVGSVFDNSRLRDGSRFLPFVSQWS